MFLPNIDFIFIYKKNYVSNKYHIPQTIISLVQNFLYKKPRGKNNFLSTCIAISPRKKKIRYASVSIDYTT